MLNVKCSACARSTARSSSRSEGSSRWSPTSTSGNWVGVEPEALLGGAGAGRVEVGLLHQRRIGPAARSRSGCRRAPRAHSIGAVSAAPSDAFLRRASSLAAPPSSSRLQTGAAPRRTRSPGSRGRRTRSASPARQRHQDQPGDHDREHDTPAIVTAMRFALRPMNRPTSLNGTMPGWSCQWRWSPASDSASVGDHRLGLALLGVVPPDLVRVVVHRGSVPRGGEPRKSWERMCLRGTSSSGGVVPVRETRARPRTRDGSRAPAARAASSGGPATTTGRRSDATIDYRDDHDVGHRAELSHRLRCGHRTPRAPARSTAAAARGIVRTRAAGTGSAAVVVVALVTAVVVRRGRRPRAAVGRGGCCRALGVSRSSLRDGAMIGWAGVPMSWPVNAKAAKLSPSANARPLRPSPTRSSPRRMHPG